MKNMWAGTSACPDPGSVSLHVKVLDQLLLDIGHFSHTEVDYHHWMVIYLIYMFKRREHRLLGGGTKQQKNIITVSWLHFIESAISFLKINSPFLFVYDSKLNIIDLRFLIGGCIKEDN